MDERHYAKAFREGQGKPVMEMSRDEASGELVRRARCYARQVRGVAAMVTTEELRAVASDDHDLRDKAAGFDDPVIYSRDPKAYARHQDQFAACLIAQGKTTTLREAHRMANAAAPDLAARAGFRLGQPDAETAAAEAHYSLLAGARPGEVETPASRKEHTA